MGQKLLDSKFKKITTKIRTQKFWNNADLNARDRDRAVSMISDLLEEERMLSEPRNKPVFGFSTLQDIPDYRHNPAGKHYCTAVSQKRYREDNRRRRGDIPFGDLDCKRAKR